MRIALRLVIATPQHAQAARARRAAGRATRSMPLPVLGRAAARGRARPSPTTRSIKAHAAAAATGIPALADDSGIVVHALDGAPGVRSARYAGEAADGRAEPAQAARRDARTRTIARAAYVCALALAEPDGPRAPVRRPLRGAADRAAPRGTGGFGYDPVFVPDDLERRRAHDGRARRPAEKDAISHRGRAVRALSSGCPGRCDREPAGAPATASRRGRVATPR